MKNCFFESDVLSGKVKQIKGKADDLYRGSMQFVIHRRTALQYPLVHWTLCCCQQYGAFSMKALARYQIILLGEQRHIGVNNLPRVVARILPWSESNPRPLDHESNALPLHHRVTSWWSFVSNRTSFSSRFKILSLKHIRVTTLTFQGHVTSSVT